jgi:hypothetical protein
MTQHIGITFKDEDEVDGIAIGPVLVWDLDHPSLRQTPIGVTVTEMVPYGEPIPGLLADLGWMTKPKARWIAEQCGVELGEA